MNFPVQFVSSHFLPSIRCRSCNSALNSKRVIVYYTLLSYGYDSQLAADISMNKSYMTRIYAYSTGRAYPPFASTKIVDVVLKQNSALVVNSDIEQDSASALASIYPHIEYSESGIRVDALHLVCSVLYAVQLLKHDEHSLLTEFGANITVQVLSDAYSILTLTDTDLTAVLEHSEEPSTQLAYTMQTAYGTYLDHIVPQRAQLVVYDIVSEFESRYTEQQLARVRGNKYCCRQQMIAEANRYFNQDVQLLEQYADPEPELTVDPEDAVDTVRKTEDVNIVSRERNVAPPNFRPKRRTRVIRAGYPSVNRGYTDTTTSTWLQNTVLSFIYGLTPQKLQQIDLTTGGAATVINLARQLAIRAELNREIIDIQRKIRSAPRLSTQYALLRRQYVRIDSGQVSPSSMTNVAVDIVRLDSLINQYNRDDPTLSKEWYSTFATMPNVVNELVRIVSSTSSYRNMLNEIVNLS